MLIFLGVTLFLILYGTYRMVRDGNLSFFRRLGGMLHYTLFRGNRTVSALLWTTVGCSVFLSNLLGARDINLTPFNPLSHFLFGYLSRELLTLSNEYYPYLDRLARRLPERVGKYVNPTTASFVLCMGNGIQEEIQKLIPGLKSLVWTNLKDQITDAFMDTGGILFSAWRARSRATASETGTAREDEARDTT
ncbi:hypothetical protein [Candidatus Solincola tengchongensis]|uniref:hypothetical protein n=1 Tax=Candidatus Solincola tengchongensis TaxID=2900693 RepID=UPI00257DF35B|nr:hypothetical protein [Candidatus Solincola tengchongensis]